MVQHKKNSAISANGNTAKELPKMSYQKRDTPENRSGGGNANKGANKSNGTPSSFRTDGAISSSRGNRERVLQPWVAPSGSEGTDMTLEKSTSGRAWDQFAANERQFGITTTYDENIYTTVIDKSHPLYKERLAKADKAAKEIEGSATTTAHHAEERQMNFVGGDDAGDDEEEKYSGVRRQDLAALGNRETKYTPPARRAPTANSTVKGAPVDPAIISSQLRTQKPQVASKQEDKKAQATSSLEAAPVPLPVQPPEAKAETKVEKPSDPKPTNQASVPLKPSAATSRTMSPQKDAQGPVKNATSTVEFDVLKEFKSFAQQQRMNVDKARHTKAKADKEVKLTELKRFASNFKLPTPVPLDLISIIAKDPEKQREIQEKANRDAQEVAQRKLNEAKAKGKKEPVGTAAESQSNATPTAPAESRTSRPANAPSATGPSGPMRNQGGRVPPNYQPFPNNRSGQQHMGQQGRQGLTHRIRESQKSQAQELRIPPTGPANAINLPFPPRMGGSNHLSAKLNPNSHEFRPNAFAPSFSPNGHPSASSSPRSSINHAHVPSANAVTHVSAPIIISKKGRTPDPKKCNILNFAKTIQPPETKNWGENGNLRPSYDTPPTWRSVADEEKEDSTMHLTCDEYFERQPFTSQPTPTPPHLLPQHIPHHHQLPLHMQHGAHNVGPRHSPHAPPVQMHGGQHNAVPHTPFNGSDDHRMIHSNSNQSYSSPRMTHQVPMAYPATMHSTPQMPYGQHMMPSFMGPGAPQMNNFNRSLSNNTQFMPQQSGAMAAPMMMQPHFMGPGMVAGPPQMHMYAAGQPFIPAGNTPQPIPGAANGYPSPGRPAAPMMVPGGSSQGQVMYAQSPSMQFQQPFAQPQGQINNNMRPSYNGAGSQYGSSPQQMHQYAGPPQRNGSSGYNKNYQNHNQHHGPGAHAVPAGPQARAAEVPDEAK
ncbi:hypothetical protein F5B22DRAFT_645920 [Xylaria bambusicola]|uniref:uncharacterized protein n=1 Tax=Xylaria bambusicola TaxID=326684 RepID=UPI002007638E|nr:uncharacterized protein F5B22DRAFT_645920 [Xylaria bambusicola]KAI0517287.1 hypothetical protein F5B22DRAFT_645920 [Xylaria bambusicola]